MSEPDDRLDDRLRVALGDLGEAAQRRVRPAGAAAVPAAGRRHRRTVLAARTAFVLVLAGGLAAGGWLARDAPAVDGTATPGCVPAEGSAFLPLDATDALRTQVGNALKQSPGVASTTFESRQDAFENFSDLYRDIPDLVASTKPGSLPEAWKFTLHCAADYPAVKNRLDALPGVDVVCSCDPPALIGPTTTPGRSESPSPTR